MSEQSVPISYRGITAWCDIENSDTLDSHIVVRLWYSPRHDGESVPAFEAHARAAEASAVPTEALAPTPDAPFFGAGGGPGVVLPSEATEPEPSLREQWDAFIASIRDEGRDAIRDTMAFEGIGSVDVFDRYLDHIECWWAARIGAVSSPVQATGQDAGPWEWDDCGGIAHADCRVFDKETDSYWPPMVSIEIDNLGLLTVDDARSLGELLIRAADRCAVLAAVSVPPEAAGEGEPR